MDDVHGDYPPGIDTPTYGDLAGAPTRDETIAALIARSDFFGATALARHGHYLHGNDDIRIGHHHHGDDGSTLYHTHPGPDNHVHYTERSRDDDPHVTIDYGAADHDHDTASVSSDPDVRP